MQTSFFKKIIWTLFYMLIFTLLVYSSYNYLDTDLGWHLKVGEEIANEKAVPSFEYYNYILEGEKWVDHEWLLNYISFWIYDNLGYVALTSFFALIVVFTLILLTLFTKNYFLSKGKNKPFYLSNKQTALIMFFQLLGTMAMAPHLGVRLQEITLLYIALLLIFLADFTAKKNYKILFFLIPLFYIWACTHAGFLIGICILLFYIGVKFSENILRKLNSLKLFKFSDPMQNKNILILCAFGVLSIGATFFTPYGFGLYSFLSEYTNTFYMKLIAEWLPFYYAPIPYKQLFYSAVISTALILFFVDTYFAYKKEKVTKVRLWLLSISILFMGLSFKSKRHFPLFFVVSFPLIILLSEKALIYPPKLFNLLKKSKIVKFYFICGLLLVCAGFLAKTNFTNSPFDKKHYCQFFPCDAINFIQENDQYDDYNIFNNYDWGGYMVFAYPERKLFIDGRLPQYKFAGHTLLEEYLDFFDEEKSEELLDLYNVQIILYKKRPEPKNGWIEKHILMVREKEESKKKDEFKDYLKERDEWVNVYEDSLSIIYVNDKQ